MNSMPRDQAARDRFTTEWGVNFAVVANAGSGKTTAISERLAAMALSPEGAEILARTAVVTYTKKAAAQIEQRARSVLLRRMAEGEGRASRPWRASSGSSSARSTASASSSPAGTGARSAIHLNPSLVEDERRRATGRSSSSRTR